MAQNRSFIETVMAKGRFVLLAALLVMATLAVAPLHMARAACQVPNPNYGSSTSSVNLPGSGTYRVWTRVMPVSAGNNSYLLEVDGNACYEVGGGSIPLNTWTWVDFQNGNSQNKVTMNLSGGSHSFKLIGSKPDLKVDKVVFTSDLNCVPVGNGDNCNVPADTTAPVTELTAPKEGAAVAGTVNITATASDNVGVSKVEFYVNSTLIGTDSTSPYATAWDTTKIANGQHRLTVKAYDAANNVSTDTYTVTVRNGDTQAPAAPTDFRAEAPSFDKVVLSWSAATDDIGVTGYRLTRNGTMLAQLGTETSYADAKVAPNTQYEYRVVAVDAAGNTSAAATTTVKTSAAPVSDKEPPTVPEGVKATAVSKRQIDLRWNASTDNVGVKGYDVYQVDGNNQTKLASVTTTSFGVTNLRADTEYKFFIKAVDAAGNSSAQSATVAAKTQSEKPAPQLPSVYYGLVMDNNTHRLLRDVKVKVEAPGKKYIFTAKRGIYWFVDVPAGRYTVTYSAPGYTSKSFTVTISSGKFVRKDVELLRRR